MRRKGSAKGESREGNWQFSLSNLADHPVRSGRTRLNNTLIGCFSFSTLSFLSSLSSQTWRPGSGGPGGLAGEKMLVLVQPWWLVLGSHHLMVNVAWSTGPATVWDNIITTIIWGSQPWPATSTTQTTFTRHIYGRNRQNWYHSTTICTDIFLLMQITGFDCSKCCFTALYGEFLYVHQV